MAPFPTNTRLCPWRVRMKEAVYLLRKHAYCGDRTAPQKQQPFPERRSFVGWDFEKQRRKRVISRQGYRGTETGIGDGPLAGRGQQAEDKKILATREGSFSMPSSGVWGKQGLHLGQEPNTAEPLLFSWGPLTLPSLVGTQSWACWLPGPRLS